MKAIFTGTEKDLINAGFIKEDYGYIFQGDLKPDFIIITANNVIIIGGVADMNNAGACICETALSKLGELINKDLVKWG